MAHNINRFTHLFNIYNGNRVPIKRKYNRKPYFNHFDLSDEEYMKRYRLSKQNVRYVGHLISKDIRNKTTRNRALSVTAMLLLTLRVYATGSFLITAADYCGVSVMTASRTVKKVSKALAKLYPKLIQMPKTSELQKTANDFYNIARFPKVLGSIDCTHVRIESPGGNNAELFRNRKGYFSFNVQAICNANLEIMDLVARWPGSAHDSNIFNNSKIRARLENGEFRDYHLLGDSGYGIKSYLMTPLSNPVTEAEILYNESHIRTRNTIERCFGVLKRRFPILSLGMRISLDTVMAVIVACVVLHNIARKSNDEEPPIEFDINEQSTDNQGLVVAGLSDLARPADALSVPQCAALAATGIIWSRYSLVIIPKNWGLFSVNLFVGLVQSVQLGRAYLYSKEKSEKEAAAAAAGKTPALEATK